MSRKLFATWVAGLIALSAVFFIIGRDNPFVLDAVNKIAANPDVRSSQFNVASLFNAYSAEQAKGSHLRNDPSRPVTYFCYWLLWKIGDGAPWPFHLFAILLHTGSAFLVGMIVLRLLAGQVAAIEASFLFLILPLNIGVVFYPFALSDVIAAFFILLILYLSFKPTALTRDLVAALAFALACGAKQSAVIAPVLVFIVNPHARRLLTLLSALTAIYLTLRFLQFGQLGDLEAEATFAPLEYFLSQGVMILKYAKLLLMPYDLSLDHWVRSDDYSLFLKIAAWLGIAVATFASFKHRRDSWNWLAAGWLLFLIPLLPVSSFLPTTDLFVERRAYMSSFGFLLMFAGGVLRSRGQAAAFLAIFSISLYGWTSVQRVQSYAQAENIYREALKLYPEDARNLNNLATLQLQAGRYNEGFETLQAARKADANNIEVLANLGALYQMPEAGRMDMDKAEELYHQALALQPAHIPSLQNMGYLQLSKKQPVKAREFFARGLQLSPRAVLLLVGMGQAEEGLANRPAALQYYEAALREEPGHPLAMRAVSHLKSGHDTRP